MCDCLFQELTTENMFYTRKKLEQSEFKHLASYAVKSAETAGRKYPEAEDEYRLCFQRDKERVIHSKAFRRLDEKTQVFTAGTGDHYRTRLTHTLEVAQISRGISRRLGLNEDLAEVIALSHDLGHPPFGHSGEEALDECLAKYGLEFEHNQQSQRVVEKLEKAYPNFEGLNLSLEVLDGLIKHQTAFDQAGKEFEVSAHLEAQIVNFGDEIAYTNHDVDDGLRSGLISLEELDHLSLWVEAKNRTYDRYGVIKDRGVLINRVVSTMMGMMIDNLAMNTEKSLEANCIKTLDEVKAFKGRIAKFDETFWGNIKDLRTFLYDNFYLNPLVVAKNSRGKEMIAGMFDFYMGSGMFVADSEKDLAIMVKDYIAGMTDGFLTAEYKKIFQ